jgi:hypothetical protein
MTDEKERLGLLKADTEDESWALWSKYVLISLEKLAEEVRFYGGEHNHFKEEVLKSIAKVKEEIHAEMSSCKESRHDALEKVRKDYEKCVNDLKTQISDLKTKKIEPMSKDLTSIKVKMGFYAAIASILASSLIFALFNLVKDYFFGK